MLRNKPGGDNGRVQSHSNDVKTAKKKNAILIGISIISAIPSSHSHAVHPVLFTLTPTNSHASTVPNIQKYTSAPVVRWRATILVHDKSRNNSRLCVDTTYRPNFFYDSMF
jgi:hypothetical protein